MMTCKSVDLPSWTLHKRVNNCHHEIVRASKKSPNVIPTNLQIHVVWSHAPECSSGGTLLYTLCEHVRLRGILMRLSNN